ncbi:MAG: TetM/TetW/TetO/TetS family tetracycline resistance ribosomal protection protein [Tyzzerella sp.]|nr:TetM/TetW/TetO/TetS family tetracycline resistance ribosomal protection protein [Tyzzerella sp.]
MTNNRLVVGILAHVDAGKTTLAESILYLSGNIRKLGRVDHGNAFLDTYELERSRGITIFSKQAEVKLREKEITLLDTPGHVDFSAEMERTLQVLDYAILVISGADGVQGHVKTLWKLLERYEIPVFLFINKMDQDGTDKEALLTELKKQLHDNCVDFSSEQDSNEFLENVAVCDEKVLEQFLEGEEVSAGQIQQMIQKRKIFPCYFGSALKLQGIEEFLEGFEKNTKCPEYPEEFGAKVYKISRDKQGNRLTHLKITGGSLKVKTELKEEEKVDQIRIYSGNSFTPANEIFAGSICAVTGLQSTRIGDGFGLEEDAYSPMLEPVLTYQIQLPEGCDVHGMFLKLKQLEEEEPELHIVWNEPLGEIHAQVMGEVQIEILKNMIAERFLTEVEFGTGNIVYKETIAEAVEGAGHYEPLRHYAEVRLLLEPGERGSGLKFQTDCSEDILDRNWQRLVLTHLQEKRHLGVLTGSEITDMKITLVNGRAHLKHTEGGDFRQATYRAVRQGLKRASSILLEPVYEYQLEVPSEMIGRAMSDIQKMQGTFSQPEIDGDMSVLKGTAPVLHMRDYQTEVVAYSRGLGRLFCTLKGYEPCHNSEEVIAQIGYDSEADLDNPTGSVFCSHGAGFVVHWSEVENHMHTESLAAKQKQMQKEITATSYSAPLVIDDEELKEIFERTYGPMKRERYDSTRIISSSTSQPKKVKKQEQLQEVLLVDGYNVIFAWEDLKELSKVNIEGARGKLMDVLCNYQGYRKNIVILVFDGYKVPGNIGEVLKYHNIYVVYTKEAETADQYIEKTVQEIGKKYQVKVATSDALEQMIIIGQGAHRISARDLLTEIKLMNQEIREEHLEKTKKTSSYLFEGLPEELADFMDDVRMGRREFHELEEKESD